MAAAKLWPRMVGLLISYSVAHFAVSGIWWLPAPSGGERA